MRSTDLSVRSTALLLALSTAFACASQELPWPYNLPPHVKYYPEHEALVKRNNEILQRLQQESPMVVKKMSSDPGEMFFLDYWFFEHGDLTDMDSWTNTSLGLDYDAPFPLHATHQSRTPRLLERYVRLPIPAADLFSKRDFSCPSGTNACTSINRPNACCPSGSTCQLISNTGLGDVGCCDAASTCAGSLSQCPSGYTGCPNNPGGGCCLPGFQCYQEGCVQTSTTFVIATPSPTSTSQPTVIETTTVVVTPATLTSSSQSISSTSASSTSPTTITSTSTSSQQSSIANSLVCSPSYRSCPASLGGGCCPTSLGCARDGCPELTSTASLAPPVRGTSSSPTTTSLSSYSGCPTGYYACSAYHPGGCCQVDRDCSTMSCPTRSGVTVVAGSGTIVAPSGASVSQGFLTGTCAGGWSTCAASVGGGCCPSGYSCGTAACTAAVSGQTATQGKIAPNGASKMLVGEHLFSWCVGTMVLGLLTML